MGRSISSCGSLLSVDGLRSDAVTVQGPAKLPNFYRLRQQGSYTDNARTDFDFISTLPNHTSMLSGRGVLGPAGHQWTINKDSVVTIHQNKGSYVPSVLDVVHDHGLRTGVYATKTKFDVYDRSYDAVWSLTPGSAYLDSIVAVDASSAKSILLIDTDSRFTGRTFVILTADHGGKLGTYSPLLREPRRRKLEHALVFGVHRRSGHPLLARRASARQRRGQSGPSQRQGIRGNESKRGLRGAGRSRRGRRRFCGR
jgi:hypothetical protein